MDKGICPLQPSYRRNWSLRTILKNPQRSSPCCNRGKPHDNFLSHVGQNSLHNEEKKVIFLREMTIQPGFLNKIDQILWDMKRDYFLKKQKEN
jgi:hypothetical protein